MTRASVEPIENPEHDVLRLIAEQLKALGVSTESPFLLDPCATPGLMDALLHIPGARWSQSQRDTGTVEQVDVEVEGVRFVAMRDEP